VAARKEYFFQSIGPGVTAGVFIHGHATNEAVAYSVVPFENSRDPFGSPPVLDVALTVGDTQRHVDGTVARTVFVRNNAGFNDCSVQVLSIVESTA
jgi:hypothetical protein